MLIDKNVVSNLWRSTNTRWRAFVCGIALVLPFAVSNSNAAPLPGSNELLNGFQWADTAGNPIDAHGGGVIKVGQFYYWFGENRQSDNHFQSVSCYRSSDLVNWTKVSDALTKNSHAELNYSWIERPKVIYNAATGKYVMWMHWENGDHYGEARAAVAWSYTVDGPYTYVRSFRPFGYMSRDSTLFLDDDGKGYFISSSDENATTRFYRLTPDFLDVEEMIGAQFVNQYRESPAVFKRNGVYFFVSSTTTGWAPNQQKYAYSTALNSGWSGLNNLGDFWGFASQTAFILPVQSSTGSTSYLYMGDRWAGAWNRSVNDGSGYVWSPIYFPTNTSMYMNWNNTLTIDLTRNDPVQGFTKKFRLRNKKSNQYLDIANASQNDGASIIQWPLNYNNNQVWDLEYKGHGDFYLTSQHSGKVIEVPGWSGAAGAALDQWTKNDGDNQRWHFIEKADGYVIWNSYSGKSMQVRSGSTAKGAQVEQGVYQDNLSSQRWAIETLQ